MAWVLVQSDYNRDVICVPDRVAENLNRFRERFDAWLYDPENAHGYWRDVNEEFGSFRALEYDGAEAFTRWLTENVLEPGEQAYIVTGVEPSASMTELYF